MTEPVGRSDRQRAAFVKLTWAENARRGGYFSSWAVARRFALWLAAWVIEPEWLEVPDA